MRLTYTIKFQGDIRTFEYDTADGGTDSDKGAIELWKRGNGPG